MDVVKGAEEKQNFSYLLVKRDYEARSMGLCWRDSRGQHCKQQHWLWACSPAKQAKGRQTADEELHHDLGLLCSVLQVWNGRFSETVSCACGQTRRDL